MWTKQSEWLKKKAVFLRQDKESLLFAVWLLWMAVYYGVRLFRLTPWYDELYTYYYFISRGPFYAAVHWPLPNNHVGYSVLSAFLYLFGNPAVGLRGVSWLCSLGSLLLLYRICKRSLAKGGAFICVLLYSCMNLVNRLAVQGRGYALAAFCFLLAVFSLQNICLTETAGKGRKRDYLLFAFALVLGLYTLPSSVYWVLPLCLAGGVFLLISRENGRLFWLIAASIGAAAGTFMLYAVIWLAIGSNLLCKTEGGAYFGLSHIKIILTAPFSALRAGVEYMLATPYIQSVERAGFFRRFGEWLRALLDFYYTGLGMVLACVIAAGTVFLILLILRRCREGRSGELFLPLLIVCLMVLTPLMLIVQCKLPYYRVFSYMGIPIAMLLALFLQNAAGTRIFKRLPAFALQKASGAVLAAIAIVLLLSKSYNREYGMSEYYAFDALKHAELSNAEQLCVTDCYEQYLLKYYWGIECESTEIVDADYVLLHKDMEREDYREFRWEFYHTWQDIPWEYIKKQMVLIYSNEEYDLYRKN